MFTAEACCCDSLLLLWQVQQRACISSESLMFADDSPLAWAQCWFACFRLLLLAVRLLLRYAAAVPFCSSSLLAECIEVSLAGFLSWT